MPLSRYEFDESLLCFTALSLSLSLSLPLVADFTQCLYGSILALEDIDEWVWPPSVVLRTYAWWCETYDPLVAHNPMWYVYFEP